jgi:alanyl-tRNA synthetase
MSKYSELAEAVASAAAQWSQSDGGQVFVSRDLLRRAAAALRELEAERDRLHSIVAELADELEGYISARYCNADGTLVHQSYETDCEFELEIIRRARAALEG